MVKPETAVCIEEAGSATRKGRKPRLDLVGVYCSSDCALTAWARGWPWNREVRKGFEG